MSVLYSDILPLLQQELALPEVAIGSAIDDAHADGKFLPMVLWERGLLTLPQLEAILIRIFT